MELRFKHFGISIFAVMVLPTATAASDRQASGDVKAVPRGSRAWVKESDFPPALKSLGVQGRVGFVLDVDRDGEVSRCTVTHSSGSEALDENTCAIVSRRARFYPPENSSGEPSTATFEGSVDWAISNSRVSKSPNIRYSIEVGVDEQGKVLNCEIVDSGMTLADGTSSLPFPDPCPKVGSIFEDDFVNRQTRSKRRFRITKTVTELR